MAISFIAKAIESTQSQKKDALMIFAKNMGRYYPERSHEVVHASDVTKSDFCARRFVLMDVLKLEEPDRFIDAGLKATFDVGRATADLMTNEWAGQAALGNWRCQTCDMLKTWTVKPGNGCAKMQKCNWRYEEVNFVHEPSKLSGSIDLMLDLGGKKATAVEIKIIKADDFDTLKAPLGEHRARTKLYLRIIDQSKSPFKQWVDTHEAKIIYISRGFGKKNLDVGGKILPFKEFDVQRDDPAVQPYIDRAQSVADARANSTIPPKTCDSIGCQQAKKCFVKQACFSGAHG